MADKPPHDTDPAIADTQASGQGIGDTPAEASRATTRAPRSVRSGDTLGRYELGDELGEGGMAIVYRARDKELRRDVALKVLFPHLARRPDIVRRFHREARAAAGLEHANILRIYDVGGGEADDPPYIVMELIRGRTLLQELEQRGPALAEIVACVGALLADALAAAHAAAIVHRDIKPANVLIAPGGRLLLADFGVARLETEDSLVTKTGALLGTPAYMSPEQAGGDTATAKSDLYSLGATLYQLATGTLPYTGSAAKVMTLIATGALVAPVKKRPAVGPDLSRIIERLMATEPSARPASAASVAAELRALAAQGGLGEPNDELAAYFADPDVFLRERTPKVVTALISAAQAAVAEAKYPRAMALADRASVLAPGDPQVTQLIETVAQGGRSTHRRRLLGLAAAGLLLVGGGTAGVLAVRGSSGGATSATNDAGVLAMTSDASALATSDASTLAVSSDASVLALTSDAGVVAVRDDAGVVAVRDAARVVAVRGDAGLVARDPHGLDARPRVHLDAAEAIAVAVAPDAALIAPPADALPAVIATGAIRVKNDTWCDVTIDAIARGRAASGAFRVDAGHHTVTCAQGAARTWTREVDVTANDTLVVEGALLGTVEVTFEVDARVDGAAYARGATIQLKVSRHTLEAGGVRKYISVTVPCRVRATPELDCY